MTIRRTYADLGTWNVQANDVLTLTLAFASIPAGSWVALINGQSVDNESVALTPSGNNLPVVLDAGTLDLAAGYQYGVTVRNTTEDKTYVTAKVRVHRPGDGGGTVTTETFTVTTNDVDVFVTLGEQGDVFNVTKFGATGDGVTDDTAAIQAALDAAAGGGEVRLPAGTYLTGPLTIGNFTRLRGVGFASVLKLKAAATGDLLSLEADTTQGVEVRDLILDGNKSAQSAARHTLNFTNSTTGISPTAIPGGSNGDAYHAISGVYATRAKGDGFVLGGRGGTLVSNCEANACDGSGYLVAGFDAVLTDCVAGLCEYGFEVTGPNNTFVACKSFLADLDDWYLSTASYGRFVGCQSQAAYRHGWNIINTHNATITGAAVMDPNYGAALSGVAFRLENMYHCTLQGYAAVSTGSPADPVAVLSMHSSPRQNNIAITADQSVFNEGFFATGSTSVGNRVSFNSNGGYFIATFASSFTPDVTNGTIQAVTLTANMSMNRPTGDPVEGQELVFVFTQDATGGRTVSWLAGWFDKDWQPNPTAGAVSVARFFYHNGNWHQAVTPTSGFFSSKLGFFGATPVVKPAVTGSTGSNAALQSLLTALANLGLITNSTT